MSRSLKYIALILALLSALPSLADDKQKATKELDKITAMATDGTGRRTVNVSMAEMLNAKRYDLMMERRDHELNYGALLVAHQLMNSGTKMEDISAKLKAGKTIYQIADEQHLDWKKVAEQAKTLNEKIDDNLYKHFAATPQKAKQDEKALDDAANYNLIYDGVKADSDVSQSDIAKAQDRYLLWRGKGEEYAKRANKLNTADEKAAYRDNVRSGGPSQGSSGGAPPTLGAPQ